MPTPVDRAHPKLRKHARTSCGSFQRFPHSSFDCVTATPSLTVTLNATATPTATRDLLRNVTFFSSSPTSVGTSRIIDVFLTDGDGGTSNTANKTVNIDTPPKVSTIVPANNSTGISITATVVITFSEAVSAPASAFALECPAGTPIAFTSTPSLPATATTSFTLNPNSDLANGATCTVTVDKDQITDQDSIDPPNNMTADFTSSFTTVDGAPRVTSTTPVAAATTANSTTVGRNFSENVDIAANGIVLNCPAAVTLTPGLPQPNVSNLTLTPSSAQTNGASCTVTLVSTLISDSDSIDPPNQLDGNSSGDIVENDADNFTLVFTVDNPPALTGNTPNNGDSNVSVGSNITLTFSENVDVSTSSFTIGDSGGTGSDIHGSNFGTLNVAEITLNGNCQALNLSNGTLSGTFLGGTSTSGANNINLSSIAGTSSLSSGALSGATDTAFNINGGTGMISYGGSITNTVAKRLVSSINKSDGGVTLSGNLSGTKESLGINVTDNTTDGSITFSGASKVLTTDAVPAVLLNNSDNATINFTGGDLAVTTTGGTVGFNAINGASAINVTGSANTLGSTDGQALRVVNATIGTSGLTFQTISANGGVNGIVLNY
ncbi:MAG: beta strand repeat-containing protein, partial [Blastocatellia bacterium]